MLRLILVLLCRFLLWKMGLDESTTLPFMATQTLVSLRLHQGFFSCNELWWLEDEDISLPVKDSAWVLLLDHFLLFCFYIKNTNLVLSARMLKAIAAITWSLLDIVFTAWTM